MTTDGKSKTCQSAPGSAPDSAKRAPEVLTSRRIVKQHEQSTLPAFRTSVVGWKKF